MPAYPDGVPSQAGDRIHQDQRPVPVRDPPQPLQRLEHAGGRLRVDHSQDLDPALLPRGPLDLLRQDRPSPFRLDLDGDAAAPLDDLVHPVSEEAVVADQDFLSRFDEVDECPFHSRGAGARNGERGTVLGPERPVQQALDLPHHLQEG